MSGRFGFSGNSQLQKQNRCTLCLTEDDKNNQNMNVACQHNASVESALHYLRNYGASVSPPYESSLHNMQDSNSTNNTAGGAPPLSPIGYNSGGNGPCSPPVSPNYYTLTEFLLRMNRMQQENGGHHYVRPPPPSRPHKVKSEIGCLRECAFCKSNGETAEFYKSHFLKDPVGRVRCPILQRYQCPFCYATGENAHTRRYCPKNPNKMCFIKGEFVKQNLQ